VEIHPRAHGTHRGSYRLPLPIAIGKHQLHPLSQTMPEVGRRPIHPPRSASVRSAALIRKPATMGYPEAISGTVSTSEREPGIAPG
jgi:hypothetical protein